MALDMNSLAAGVAARIASGDAATRVSGDEGSAEFESSLDQARALQILQQVQASESRRKAVRPRFIGLQPFSNRGLCGESSCNCQ